MLYFLHLQARITSVGGSVLLNNGLRVMGVLAMTRAIGDKFLRKCVETKALCMAEHAVDDTMWHPRFIHTSFSFFHIKVEKCLQWVACS